MKSKKRKRRKSFGPKRLENWARKQLQKREKNGELIIIADNDEDVRRYLGLKGRTPDFLAQFPDEQYGIYEAKTKDILDAVKQLKAAINSGEIRNKGIKELGIFCKTLKYAHGAQERDEDGNRVLHVDNLKVTIYRK